MNDREFKTKPPDYYLSQAGFLFHGKASWLFSLEVAFTSMPPELLPRAPPSTDSTLNSMLPNRFRCAWKHHRGRKTTEHLLLVLFTLLQYPSPKFHYRKHRLLTTGPGSVPYRFLRPAVGCISSQTQNSTKLPQAP